MEQQARPFLPATGHHAPLWIYDSLAALLRFDRVAAELVARAAPIPGQRVLDVGCGTGNLVTFVKTQHPRVDVTGLDPDVSVLERSRRKVESANVNVRFDCGYSDAMPYADASFDLVFSTFMFHHLDAPTKRASLHEIRRVLARGGALHLVDFASASHGPASMITRHLPWISHSADNDGDALEAMLRDTGFADVTQLPHLPVRFGPGLHLVARTGST